MAASMMLFVWLIKSPLWPMGLDPALLPQYQRQRQPIARDDIGGQADQNRSRMMNKSAAQKQAHLKELQAIASDSEKARDFAARSSMIEGLRRAQVLA